MEAQIEGAQSESQVATTLTGQADTCPAHLSLATQFEDSDSEPEDLPDSGNCLDDIVVDNDDEYFDFNGQQIIFSAGDEPIDHIQDQLQQQMDNLQSYEHMVLGAESDSRIGIDEAGMGDPTVVDIVAQLHVMGKTSLDWAVIVPTDAIGFRLGG